MIATFFPVKKLKRNTKFILFGAILLIGLVAVYHEFAALKAWSTNTSMITDTGGSSWRRALFDDRVRKDHQPDSGEDSEAWRSSNTSQTWTPEYKGHANLHAFEDWCGSSTAELFRNQHYPLYPHTRTTVQKLAVYPKWTNYGLRIFGYLHPYTDGEFVFAVSSDDNSELWLSTDDSPRNIQLMAWVGKTGTEWTAPGEYEKFASQISKPVLLSAQKRYFFEVIHVQNERGMDHVEVAWRLLDRGSTFKVIDSSHISLYANESALLMGDVAHIPQTVASHQHTPTKQQKGVADMLREDPRDTLYHMHLIDSKFLQGVLPDCSYRPSYIINDISLLRYQGLNFVHLSHIYPNDYTRLTHMENENSCFYPTKSQSYTKMHRFSKYVRLDPPDMKVIKNIGEDFGFQWNKDEGFDYEAYTREKEAKPADNKLFLDYGDGYDDFAKRYRSSLKYSRKLFSLVMQETNNVLKNTSDTALYIDKSQGKDQQPPPEPHKPAEHLQSPQTSIHQQQNQTELKLKGQVKKAEKIKRKRKLRPAKKQKLKSVETSVRPKPLKPVDREQLKAKEGPAGLSQRDINAKQIKIKMTLQSLENTANMIADDKLDKSDTKVEDQEGKEDKDYKKDSSLGDKEDEKAFQWEKEKEDDKNYEEVAPPLVFDTEIHWSQTFQVNPLDIQAQRSDHIDLQCNVSGNLLVKSRDALPIVDAFMERLNKKHNGRFTLVRVLNIAKRLDRVQGNRYLLELELKDEDGQLLRLTHYIYTLILHSKQHPKPQLLLCNPVGFRWNPAATVHFIIPVKNQARWVQQLIGDMERLFRETRDTNFNLIIVDYSSTDMDVRKALQKSSVHRYEYVRLRGNFERSAGLQAGVNVINDTHSIVFLCDLHIHFPSAIIDTIRKSCVEGHMAFAPIVMRLNCGATPLDARGYWEVNGFGLLGIYKSDLDAVGGMNTREYKDRWGGEDWELLDRIIEGGLEVKRTYMRNFFHFYHSKRGMWNRRVPQSHR